MKLSDKPRQVKTATEAQRWITTLFLVICVQYFLGTVFFTGVPIIELIWLILLGAMLVSIKPASILFVSVAYLTFAVFYTTGLAFDFAGMATFSYYRTILTWFIFSALILGIARGQVRRIRGAGRFLDWLGVIHFTAIIFFSAWAFVALRDLNARLLFDFRDITGAGYLTLSDTFALFSIAYLCRERLRSWEFIVVFGLSLVVIFLLGSRTTLVFYPFSIAFLIGRRVSLRGTLAWGAVLGGIAYYWTYDRLDFESGMFFRVNTLFSLGTDESAAVRNSIRDGMLERMNENPECFLIACHPEQGLYDHSVLSAVQHFGLAGIVFLLASALIGLLRFRYITKQWYLPVLVYCAVSLVLSRAWITVVFPVFLALIIDAVLGGAALTRGSREERDPRQLQINRIG
jgi:hypothetical protein